MRPSQVLRRSRPVQLGVGAFMLAIPASAVALTAHQADAQSANSDAQNAALPAGGAQSPIPIRLSTRRLTFGRNLTVRGRVSPAAPAQLLQLQLDPASSAGWRSLSTTRVGRDGSFRFVSPVRKSGLVRVVRIADTLSPRTAPSVRTGTAASLGASSAAERVTVAARFSMRTRSVDVFGGQRADVRGTLLPGVAGRRVRLIARRGGGWQTLASARTGPRGGFDLHYTPASTGQTWVRVGFSGDRLNTGSWAHAGQVTAFRSSVASWYSDGGATACGFHAGLGVANKSLPCGTKVTFRYGGRTVTAVVDDRGPFVGGREWDLNQNVAGALGFGGVGTVWSSV